MCFHLRGQAVPEVALSQHKTIHAGLIKHHGYIPEKVAQTEHRIPIKNSAFPGG